VGVRLHAPPPPPPPLFFDILPNEPTQDAKVRAILEKGMAREDQVQQGAVAGMPPNVEVVYKDLGSVSPADCSGAKVRGIERGDRMAKWPRAPMDPDQSTIHRTSSP
jgi:hypothetical protein